MLLFLYSRWVKNAHPLYITLTTKEENILEKKVPMWEKSNLTLEEAAAYSGIGINKLRKLTNDDQCEFVLWVGTKRLIKRKKLDEYLEKHFSI